MRKHKADCATQYSHEHMRYLASIGRHRRSVRFMRYAVLAATVGLWELFTRIGVIDPFIASSPVRVVETVARLYSAGELFEHIAITLYETVLGFILGTAAGTLTAVALWWWPTLNEVLDPYLVVLNALPKIALGPILIVWFGAGVASIVVMALLISYVVTIMTVLAGFNEITGEKQLLMKTLGASKIQIFTMVVLPSSLPTIMNALKISVGMSWVGVIVGEYLVSKAGLGYLIVYGGQVFKLDIVMASIVVLCILAAIMYYAVAYIEKKLVKAK